MQSRKKKPRPPTVAEVIGDSRCQLPIIPEPPGIEAQLDPLLDVCFGADRRQTKTSYVLRQGVRQIPRLSFAVFDGPKLLGSIRFWPVAIGPKKIPAILLGPLAVEPSRRGEGIGRALVKHGLDEARRLGHRICVLVGDRPYYEPFGFAQATGLELPGPVDPARFLVAELVPGALKGVAGMVGRTTQ
jgi:predicted N-acetyltransferase YhbS